MRFLPVSLATLETSLPMGREWTYEAKLDGYRIEAVITAGPTPGASPMVTLWSRNAKDWTARFPVVADALGALPVQQAVLDGEVIMPVARGQSAFQALQRSLDSNATTAVHYVLFDLLMLDGHDVRGAPLRERRQLLRALMQHRASGSPLRAVRRFAGGAGVLERACAAGLEGVLCKRLEGRYVAGRHHGWIKVKCVQRQEFVIVGYTEPAGGRVGFGALLLGVYDDDGKLHFAGKVGTGFDTHTLLALHARLRALETARPTVHTRERVLRHGVHWVRPRLVAEVAFTEWTHDARLRHPVFHGLREDKRAAAVRRERVP